MLMRLLALLVLLLVAPATVLADEGKGAGPAERFSGTTFLYENAFSIGHGGDLAAEASRVYTMSWIFTPSFAFTDRVSTSLVVPLTEELTEGSNTFDDELIVNNMIWSLDGVLPSPPLPGEPLSGGVGIALELPTSKVARAESLVLGVAPYFTAGVRAPVLDGLSFSWKFAPSPRLQRYTTWSNMTARPCSPAAGCTFGPAGTTDTGYRNTALQITQDFSVGIAALDDRLSVGAAFQLVHGRLHPKSPSPTYPEDAMSIPANDGGDPWNLTYSLVFDVGFQVHPLLSVSIGTWTPGGMRPGGNWYNPFGNRFTQVYIDVTLYPAALASP